MPEKNKHYEVEITDLGKKGEGIGRVNDFVVFIEGAVIGDKVEVRIVKVNKSFAYGKLIKIIKASDDRVSPCCQVHSRCGGCSLQHVSYDAQLKMKTKQVQDAISRIGGLEGMTVETIVGMENPYNYRNKSQYPITKKNGELITGFYSVGSHNIIPVTQCCLSNRLCETFIAIIKKFITDYSITLYNEQNHTGLLRHIYIRTGFYTNDIMICLVVNGDTLPHASELASRLEGCITGLVININKQKTNVILGNKTITIWGKPYITDYLSGLQFKISPSSFYQVNPVQTEILYGKALEYAELNGTETVLDAYCGIGTISLIFARKVKNVIGIEIVADAVKDARRNAILNDIDNVEFIEGKAEELFPEFEECPDILIVDPPRKGLALEFIESVLKLKPEKIIYISCDPASLARDLRFFCEGGYSVRQIQPIDMFPMTMHVETVVLMSRVDG